MHYESARTDLGPNTYAYAFTSNHQQPLATINHNMFQTHIYIHWLLPKGSKIRPRGYTLEREKQLCVKLLKQRNQGCTLKEKGMMLVSSLLELYSTVS